MSNIPKAGAGANVENFFGRARRSTDLGIADVRGNRETIVRLETEFVSKGLVQRDAHDTVSRVIDINLSRWFCRFVDTVFRSIDRQIFELARNQDLPVNSFNPYRMTLVSAHLADLHEMRKVADAAVTAAEMAGATDDPSSVNLVRRIASTRFLIRAAEVFADLDWEDQTTARPSL